MFHRPLSFSPDFVVDIVEECCMFHNYVRQRYGYSFENTLSISDLENIRHEKCLRGVSANETKDVFADYFLTRMGSLPRK
jgi:hypothetical protein